MAESSLKSRVLRGHLKHKDRPGQRAHPEVQCEEEEEEEDGENRPHALSTDPGLVLRALCELTHNSSRK